MDKDETIWRYMDFTKFVGLLATRTLFFCRADRFDDAFEGSVPQKHYERGLERLKVSARGFEREIALYESFGSGMRKYAFISCWHINERESAALWKLYLKSNEGVAVRSTKSRLHTAMPEGSPPVWSVPVWYIDYATDDPPVPTWMAPFRYKRKSFEHERELSAIVYADPVDEAGKPQPPPSEYGLRIAVDLEHLVDSVYVAPTSPDWFHDLTSKVTRQFGLDREVRHSSLDSDEPVFWLS
jgi:hypothetical protein